MKTTKLFIAALFAAAGITACNTAPEQPELSEYTLTVEASMPAATKGLALSGKTLNAVWATGDQVIVLDGANQIGTLTPQSTGSATAVLKGTITGSVSVGKALTLQTPRKSWMYTNQIGTFANLSKDYSYATAGITVTAVSGNSISAGAAHFENQQAIVKFTLKDSKGSTLTVDDLTIEAASDKLLRLNGTTKSYGSIYVENDDEESALYVALRNESGAADNYTLTATVGKSTYTCTKSGVLFENGKYYGVTATMAEVVDTYSLVGSPSSIFGTWTPAEATIDMVKQSDGSYKWETNITSDPTDIAFKVVRNHDWANGSWPNGNWSNGANYTIDGDFNCVIKAGVGKLTIIFNPNGIGTLTLSYSASTGSDTYTVAGNSTAVFGTAWDPTNTANDMTKQGNVWVKTYNNVPGGTALEFKVALNHSWSVSYGKNGGSANQTHTMSATKNLTITFDPNTHYVTATEN